MVYLHMSTSGRWAKAMSVSVQHCFPSPFRGGNLWRVHFDEHANVANLKEACWAPLAIRRGACRRRIKMEQQFPLSV